MVHRDVKPDNLLINSAGDVKLLDFGLTLADQSDDEDEFSLAMIFGHDCLGTADFIPPEQSLDSFHVDPRADVYSLGCTLFVALAARRPFPFPTRLATIQAHRSSPRPRADQFQPQVPAELANIVERMMAIQPEERPRNMREVQDLLRPFARRKRWSFEFRDVLATRRKRGRQKGEQPPANQRPQALRQTDIAPDAETDAPRSLD
jgi:serine/threonine-protein kinase